jgi:hypothetical protein
VGDSSSPGPSSGCGGVARRWDDRGRMHRPSPLGPITGQLQASGWQHATSDAAPERIFPDPLDRRRDGVRPADLRLLRVWPGVRRAGLPRLSPAQEPGQRRRRRRLDQVRHDSATDRTAAQAGKRASGLCCPGRCLTSQSHHMAYSYLRWERDEPMALWQLDIVGGAFSGGRD